MESPCSSLGDPELFSTYKYQSTFIAKYYGRTLVEGWHTQPMLPWIVSEVKRLGSPRAETVFLTVTDSSVRAVSVKHGRTIFEHKVESITKFTQTADDPKCFTYLTKESVSQITLCHVFQAADEKSVAQLFRSLQEVVKETSQQNASSLPSEADAKLFNTVQYGQSQQFEVLYVGKIKVSHKRAQPLFVDEATDRFLDIEKQRQKIICKSSSKSSQLCTGKQTFKPQKSEASWSESDQENVNGDYSSGNDGIPKRRMSDTVLEEISHPLQIEVAKPEGEEIHESDLQRARSEQGLPHPLISSSLINTPTDASQTSLLSPPAHSLITHTQSLDTPGRTALMNDLQNVAFTLDHFSSIVEDGNLHRQTSLPPINPKIFAASPVGFSRPRADSSPSTMVGRHQYNRTMLFLISSSSVCLISTDKKQILFNKAFADISHCSQGLKHPEHFGIICRETTLTGMDMYVGYIFQCEAAKVVNEIMKTLKQAFHCALQSTQEKLISSKSFVFCETCPLYWFHKLCGDIDGLPPEKVQTAVMLQIASLSEREQKDIMSKFQGTVVHNQEEQNVVFMMLLRALCEQQQMRHTHISTKQPIKQESVKKGTLSSLESLKSIAKKSFPSPFESIFKASSDTTSVPESSKEMMLMKTHSLPPYSTSHSHRRSTSRGKDLIQTMSSPLTSTAEEKVSNIHRSAKSSDVRSKPDRSNSKTAAVAISESPKATLRAASPSLHLSSERSLSDTAAVLRDLQKEKQHQQSCRSSSSLAQADVKANETPRMSAKTSVSPLRNIFLKVGSQTRSPLLHDIKEQQVGNKSGSWRKAIFNRVQRPVEREIAIEGKDTKEKVREVSGKGSKRSSATLRALWKKAIMEQIILIRMEKENKELQMGQDQTFQKRIKLQYEEISPCPEDAIQKWDEVLKASGVVSYSILEEAVRYGVPKKRRGEAWCFLADQYCMTCKPLHVDETPYTDLLQKLTPYQHAILIDIGRTYPGHPYYKHALNSGQLSLFSLLKAYSLMDEDVGYCQGLSFLAGVLLLHLAEEKAFQMMKHIMFKLGFRNQYKLDMSALQVQMYQLARLTHDTVPDIHKHFDNLDISPGLYAAPWFLTFFASHFPIGFVARLLDMVFLQGIDAVFKVAILLLKIHKPQILNCKTFESAMEFIKTTLPSSGPIGMEKVLEEVLTMDVRQQLQMYQVEYMVLKEEMTQHHLPIEPERAHSLEKDNKELQRINMELSEQLQVAQNTVTTLEASVSSYQSTVRRLEMRVRSLQDERDALHHSVNVLRKRLDHLENVTGYEDKPPGERKISTGSNSSKMYISSDSHEKENQEPEEHILKTSVNLEGRFVSSTENWRFISPATCLVLMICDILPNKVFTKITSLSLSDKMKNLDEYLRSSSDKEEDVDKMQGYNEDSQT